jgi:hypothetical protein
MFLLNLIYVGEKKIIPKNSSRGAFGLFQIFSRIKSILELVDCEPSADIGV